MKATVVLFGRGRTAGRRSRKPIDIRPGRKLIPGRVTTFQRKKYLVKAVGYDPGGPVVHLQVL